MAKHTIEPRLLAKSEALTYIGVSAAWYTQHRNELDEHGFPKAHPVIKKYDKKLIDAWLDKFGGIINDDNAEAAAMLALIKNGNN